MNHWLKYKSIGHIYCYYSIGKKCKNTCIYLIDIYRKKFVYGLGYRNVSLIKTKLNELK